MSYPRQIALNDLASSAISNRPNAEDLECAVVGFESCLLLRLDSLYRLVSFVLLCDLFGLICVPLRNLVNVVGPLGGPAA